MIITICFLSQAFLLLLLLLSQEFPLLSLLLLCSCHKHASCYGCYWYSFLFLLSHQFKSPFSSSSVVSPKPPLARAMSASSSASFCGSSDRRFSSACCEHQEGKGKLVYEASRQASKIEQASKIKEASNQASVFLTASML